MMLQPLGAVGHDLSDAGRSPARRRAADGALPGSSRRPLSEPKLAAGRLGETPEQAGDPLSPALSEKPGPGLTH